MVISFDLLTGDIPHHSPKLHTSLRWEESYLHPRTYHELEGQEAEWDKEAGVGPGDLCHELWAHDIHAAQTTRMKIRLSAVNPAKIPEPLNLRWHIFSN